MHISHFEPAELALLLNSIKIFINKLNIQRIFQYVDMSEIDFLINSGFIFHSVCQNYNSVVIYCLTDNYPLTTMKALGFEPSGLVK